MKPVFYSQEDPRWRNVMYSNHGDRSQTIGTSGCGPTCFAMVASTLLGREILPPEMAQYAVARGYRTYNSGTDWGFFAAAAKHYGLEMGQTGVFDTVKKALAAGALVIASMGSGHFTGGGHYILLVGIRGDWVDVFDPNHDNTKYGADGLVDQGVRNDGKVSAKVSVFAREARQYWIFPFTKENDEPMTTDERKAFDQLREDVAAIKKLVEASTRLIPAPDWFVREFSSADLGGLILDPKLTMEGWRTTAIALRAQGLGMEKKHA